MNKRTRVVLVHLVISLLVLVGIFVALRGFWYPPPYFRIRDAQRLFLIMAGVQLVLGPLLMAVLFKPGKKGLWIDMTVISVLQAAALAWGITLLYQERPWFMVYAVDRFNVLSARDVNFDEIRDRRFLDKPTRGPLPVIANLPLDSDQYQALLMETMFEGKPDLERRPQYWSDYQAGFRHITANARTLDALRQAHPEAVGAIDRAVAQTGRSEEDLVFLPVVGKAADFAVIVGRDSGEILGAVEVNPWF